MRIFRPGIIILLTIFYLFLVSAYYYLVTMIELETSILSLVELKTFIIINKYFFALVLLTGFSVLIASKKSPALLLIINVWVAFVVTKGLLGNFDKTILGLLFLQIVTTIYFFIILADEVKEACYNSLIPKQAINRNPQYQIPVSICALKTEHVIVEGVLSNWQADSCFIRLSEKSKVKGKVVIKIDYNGHTFKGQSIIVSRSKDHMGIGAIFSISNAKNDHFNWNSLYDILFRKGLTPEMVIK